MVSWTANDDTVVDVSASFPGGSYNTPVTGNSFDLSGVVDLAQVVEIMVTGQTTGQSLSITYNPPPPPPQPTPLSDISLNGTVVSWTANDDALVDVSASFPGGSYNTSITGNSFDLSGVVDLAQVVEIMVTGQTTGQSLSITYNPPPPPPPPTPLSDISLNGTILTWNPNDDTTIVMTITMNGSVVFFSATESSPFDLSGHVDTTKVLSIVLTGTPSSASLNVPYNPPTQPPPPPVYVTCFLENAPVLTPSGYKKISKLVAGDLVMTGDGRSVPIQRVARSHVAAGPSTNPYVIPKGIYGATKRLLISPNHCVATSKGMVEARLLGLEQEDMTGSIHYYNLELPSWAKDTLVVAGVTVESLAPVRRIKLSIDQFKAKLVRQYGKITPEILAKIEQTCRIVDGGFVEFPALIRKDTESNPNPATK